VALAELAGVVVVAPGCGTVAPDSGNATAPHEPHNPVKRSAMVSNIDLGVSFAMPIF
jgi:hypothetical protein